jgi:putative Holliday junction resolvase
MGLDMGEKYIGVAVSDPLGCVAQGIETILRSKQKQKDIAALKELAGKYNVELVVVGLPRNMNGSLGEQGHKVLAFVDRLKTDLKLAVETWDERLSTVAAERVLLSADVSRARRKKVIDKMAAVIILQNYLDAHWSPGCS